MFLRTGSYTATDAYVRLSSRRERCGWFKDPSDPSKNVYLEFTKVWNDKRRCHTDPRCVNDYLYTSNLDNVVVMDISTRIRRRYYESESEDDYCSSPPPASQPTRKAYYITLAIKYSSARFVLVGKPADETEEMQPPSKVFGDDDYAPYDAEYDEFAEFDIKW